MTRKSDWENFKRRSRRQGKRKRRLTLDDVFLSDGSINFDAVPAVLGVSVLGISAEVFIRGEWGKCYANYVEDLGSQFHIEWSSNPINVAYMPLDVCSQVYRSICEDIEVRNIGIMTPMESF